MRLNKIFKIVKMTAITTYTIDCYNYVHYSERNLPVPNEKNDTNINMNQKRRRTS